MLEYKLYADDGDDFSSNYNWLNAVYDGQATTYTADDTFDGLITGRVYRFQYVAVNLYGDSLGSNPLIAGFGASPPAPAAPTIN